VGGTPLAFGEGDTKSRIKNVLNYKNPRFWVFGVTACICIAAVVCFMTNPLGSYIPNPYVQVYIPGQGNILGSVDTESYLKISEDFAIGADKYGRAVFKDPHKAFKTFKKLYADTISYIQKEEDLPALSHKNYNIYKVYGWQMTDGTQEQAARSRFVTRFLDVYENSFTKGVPNTEYVEPTTEDDKTVKESNGASKSNELTTEQIAKFNAF